MAGWRGAALLAALICVATRGPASAQEGPAPTLMSRVECRGLEGPCDYRYALVNPAGVAGAVRAFTLLESAEADDRTSNSWRVTRLAAGWRFEETAGLPAGWTQGGFWLASEALPRVALAEVEGPGGTRSVPVLVPGQKAASLGGAAALVSGLRAELASLVAAGWIAPGPGRGILDSRLRALLEYLERDQRTESLHRLRALIDEVGRLAAPAAVTPGRTPGGFRPLLGGATPLAPEVRDLVVATLRVAIARLGALR